MAALAVLVLVAVLAGYLSFWLWTEYSLFALAFCGLLLFGGAPMLPSKNDFAYSSSLGFCIGVFLGGAAGGAKFIAGMVS